MIETIAYATIVLILIQGGLMLMDEFYFHRLRGLGTWERWGHPADTAVFFLTVCVPCFFSVNSTNLLLYISLSVASTVIITKDEWVHTQEAPATEHFLHALLFVLHAPILIGVGSVWFLGGPMTLLQPLPIIIALFGIYQFSYWVIYRGYLQHQNTSYQQRSIQRPG